MDPRFARAWEFERWIQDGIADDVIELSFGSAIRCHGMSGVYDANVARLDRPTGVRRILDELEEMRGDLKHDKLLVPDANAGRELRAGLEEAGFETTELVVMAHTGDAREVPSPARETDAADLRWLRIEATSADVAQLLERVATVVPTRFFAAPADGDPLAYCALFADEGIAQIEEVMTLDRARGTGLGGAVVAAATAAAQDADLLFLTADADDWTPGWYGRLGFEEIGRRFDFTRAA